MNNRLQKLVPHPGSSLVVLIGSYVFFLCILSFLGQWMLPRFSDPQRGLRIFYVIQAVFTFILPAILAAITATRLPARLLAIEKCPKLQPILITLIVMLVSIPAMNLIIKWNSDISLPVSMQGIEDSMRNLESQAQESINILMGGKTVGNLIMSVLIIGVLAGFSEELFFRGAMQRLLGYTSLGPHAAIILTAVIFSALHLQFYGFVPRLLLGILFGYLLYWSGSLWLPIIAHIFNNTLACIVQWNQGTTTGDAEFSPEITDIAIAIASMLITAAGLWILRHKLKEKSEKTM